MTIKQYVASGMQCRLEKLEEIGAPEVLLQSLRKAIENPNVGGDTFVLNEEIITKEVKAGRGGKQYIVFNGNINFFPNARYGMYISVNQ